MSSLSSPPTLERSSMKKSRSVDLGKLCRRSAAATTIGGAQESNIGDNGGYGLSCGNQKFSVNAKMAHAVALSRCPAHP